jgi:hypothetical protein
VRGERPLLGGERGDLRAQSLKRRLAGEFARLRARPAPASGDPAYERDPFVRLVQARQEHPSRERKGIDEQCDGSEVDELEKARNPDPILRLHGRGVEAFNLRTGQRTRPDGNRRTLLELADTGGHSVDDATEQVPRRELLMDGPGGRVNLVQMRRRAASPSWPVASDDSRQP